MSEKMAPYDASDYTTHGAPSKGLINLYQKLGHSGYGMIVTGNMMVDENHIEVPGNLILEKKYDNETRRSAFKKFAKGATSDGAILIGQLNHCGKKTSIEYNPTPFSATNQSHVDKYNPGSKFGEAVELTKNQIKELVVDKFVYSAKFLYDCGFNGIELQCSYQFLLASFVGERNNTRSDEYGGNLKNRTRIIKEIYDGVRKALPVDAKFAVGIKLSQMDFVNESNHTDEAVEFVNELEEIGFDYITLTGGFYEKWSVDKQLDVNTKEFYFKFAKDIRTALSRTRLIIGGGIRTAKKMVSLIKNHHGDALAIGRPCLQEPDFVKKLLAKKIQSLSVNALDEQNFFPSMTMAWAQMIAMGKTTFKEANGDVCYGIPDISNKEIAESLLNQS
uniref:Oxidored_FMN domain-containing protein n=1 Tax=Rhabditophanes sp. KR3021 TaxID=114890 RepID=A0AC35U1M5_9BILA